MKGNGYLLFVLNSHIPYVRRLNESRFGEDLWFYEIISETYLPMIQALNRLVNDGLKFKITFSISPVLMEMINNRALIEGYIKYEGGRVELAEREISRTSSDDTLNRLAKYYHKIFIKNLEDFNRYRGNLLSPIVKLKEEGVVEIIPTSFTHAFLPMLSAVEEGVEKQIRFAVKEFKSRFDELPKGFWLPECGYYNGVEYYLEENGIQYSFLDTHGVLFADKKPKYGVYAPVKSKNGVAFFARDAFSSREVMSSEEGYLSDPSYRDFYRDLGFEFPADYISDGMGVEKFRGYTGIKYYSKLKGMSRVYDPEVAKAKAMEHAENFIYKKKKQIGKLASLMDRDPLIVFACDTEFFGHWWYEGIYWMENVIRNICESSNDDIRLISASDYLEIFPLNQVVEPSFSSWGTLGYSEVWLSKSNDWVYRHVHKVSERMKELVYKFKNPSQLEKRALNQALREMLLVQSSDWISMAKYSLNPAYGTNRIKEHIYNFNKIYSALLSKTIDETWLRSVEARNALYSDIDYRDF